MITTKNLKQAKEITIELSIGKISAKAWGDPTGEPIIALHGWLDNAASFDFLIPRLLEKNPHLYIIAIDFPGHGRSCHHSSEMGSFLMEYASCVLALIRELNLEKVSLLCHSMGGGVGTLVSGTRPERIRKLILIESLGLLTQTDDQIVSSYRKFLDEVLTKQKKIRMKRFYNQRSIQKIIQSRQKALLMRDETGTINTDAIDWDSARVLVERNMKRIDGDQWMWISDPLVRAPSSVYLTEAQMSAFIKEIRCPTCCIFAEDSSIYKLMKKKYNHRFKQFKIIDLNIYPKGGHHIHMRMPEVVVNTIHDFFNRK